MRTITREEDYARPAFLDGLAADTTRMVASLGLSELAERLSDLGERRLAESGRRRREFPFRNAATPL
jgi:hypothetical protein